MTEDQFEALKEWIGTRSSLLHNMAERSNDIDYVRARLRELEEADEEAKRALVDPLDVTSEGLIG